jgi:hypothetical protein
MPSIPHWYIVRNHMDEETYVNMFRTIRAQGEDRAFGNRIFRYLEPGDGWKYWVMTKDESESVILNRARVEPGRTE